MYFVTNRQFTILLSVLRIYALKQDNAQQARGGRQLPAGVFVRALFFCRSAQGIADSASLRSTLFGRLFPELTGFVVFPTYLSWFYLSEIRYKKLLPDKTKCPAED